MKTIYLDYASLTPIDKGVSKYMKKYETEEYMNPSAIYSSGVMAKKVLKESREKIAQALHAHADEVIFTGSGTEANNLALNWVPAGKHIIVSVIEHSSIIETARALEKKGVKVSYISVDKNGLINLDEFKKALRPETVLVSIMTVNNEIGTIQPIQEIAKIIRHARKNNNSIYPIFHTDACQAGLVPLYVEKLGVDLLTLDSHKIYGPRGIGLLYVQRGTNLQPIIHGGGQQKGLRSGTENIPGIAGLAFALEISEKIRNKEFARLTELKNFFIKELIKLNPKISINGQPENTSPHILNISIPDIDNEFLVLQLDTKGIECSTKSACLHNEDESYVLKSIGADSRKSVRFSFGRRTTKNDLKFVIKTLKELIS